jgi:hypothetical protein
MHKPNLFRHATRGYERQMIYGLFIEITISLQASAEVGGRFEGSFTFSL